MKLIGLDLGYYQVKAYDGSKQVKFISMVGSPDVSRLNVLGGETDKIIQVNGKKYMVGESAAEKSRMRQRREDRNWIESEEYRVLFYRALANFQAGEVHAITGLPNDFFSDAPRLKEILEGKHNFLINDLPVSYTVKANVIMQPFGALASMAFDNMGNVQNQDYFELTGVIDVGGKTTNILTAKNFSDISPQTISKDIGGWDVIRAVRSRLQTEYPKSNLTDHQIADAIVEGKFKEFGEWVDISDLLADVLPMLAEDIIGKASSLWGSGANLSSIIITGGGSRLIGEHIKAAFPHAKLVEDPVFANAIGYYRYGLAVK